MIGAPVSVAFRYIGSAMLGNCLSSVSQLERHHTLLLTTELW